MNRGAIYCSGLELNALLVLPSFVLWECEKAIISSQEDKQGIRFKEGAIKCSKEKKILPLLLSRVTFHCFFFPEALRYVDNYAKGSEMWEGFPIRVNVPRDAILLGCKGVTASQSIVTLGKKF